MDDRKQTPPLSPEQALDWPGLTGTDDAVIAAVNRRLQRRRQRRRGAAAVVASVAFAVLAGVTWFRQDVSGSAPLLATTATLTQPSRQLLADGSQIELNGDAQVRVDFSAEVRRVTVLRGEAHFAVAHDITRPFVVVAGDVSVRAVGTAFAVRLAPAWIDVLVTDGRVAIDRATVDPIAAPVRPIAFVDKGARVAVAPADLAPNAPSPAVLEVSAAALAEELAWRVPRLEFNDTPLREAVALFNRHSDVLLSLTDSSIGELRVSGVVRADNISALLQLLQADYGISAQRRSDREFLLNRSR